MTTYTLIDASFDEEMANTNDRSFVRGFVRGLNYTRKCAHFTLTITDDTGQTKTLTGPDLLAWARTEEETT